MGFKSILAIFSIAFLLTICFGCEGCGGFGECLGGDGHFFEQKVMFEPGHSQYHIGDTIQVGLKFSCMDLLNLVTGFNEDYCGLTSIASTFQLLNIDHRLPADSSTYIYAFGNFDFQPVEGGLNQSSYSSWTISYETKDSDYGFKFFIIPKVVGKYAAFIGNVSHLRLPGSDRCDSGGFNILNGNSDNHIELLEAYNAPGQVSDYERKHVFCFEVIE